MLSTNQPSSIQRRRTQHRRQNSTPAAFEALHVRPLPANTRPQRPQRSGMSLDLRGLNLATMDMSAHQQPLLDQTNPAPVLMESFQQEDSTVSITNIGQPQQQFMQVAQPHSQPQPGYQEPFLRSPVQQSLPSPRTPVRTLRAQSPAQVPISPSKVPTEQQSKALQEHIQAIYGSSAQVFINILPTPTATPQKPAQLPSHEPFNAAPMPPNFKDIADINFEPTSSAMTFDFENPDADMGYESSSYYTSDALSPSPISSPHQRSAIPFLEGIVEETTQESAFSQAPSLLPTTSTSSVLYSIPMTQELSRSSVLSDLEVDASLEYTGISPEEVQRYISEQDTANGKWTCLYPDCGKMFGRRENIRSHVQTHLGDRQFRCNGCGKCFVRQHDLKRHAKIHTGNKPYKCPCGAGFARQDALTRHRQRGMCVGGFADAVRRQAKRGRPKKNRPEMDARVDKANRTRRALVSAASSVSAESPPAEDYSNHQSPASFEEFGSPGLQYHGVDLSGFGEPMSSSSVPISFETASSPFTVAAAEEVKQESFATSSSFTADTASLNILQQLSRTNHTPPMSPANARPFSAGSSDSIRVTAQPVQQDRASTPSRSSIQSNPFSTPPTSPIEPKDELDDLFNSLPESSSSQFDLEMKAMTDFTSLDNGTYDFLDFGV
ncbi:hypothetical protein K491DRAFT_668999 [Lophiostoma macrostomum CBS 122681]|uniref:C2H2-type domain-containing protein n=1 Tax=Lophiostoma macrostomum CBS 122681 TaxID=1314788 RepID=A0A6A6ST81_9PLEO|nr:hypothetical protein K491DRAFT_668999 [Lophiostoma macrostomum CBS 122681]